MCTAIKELCDKLGALQHNVKSIFVYTCPSSSASSLIYSECVSMCAEWIGRYLFRFSTCDRKCVHCGIESVDTIVGGIPCVTMPSRLVAEVYTAD